LLDDVPRYLPYKFYNATMMMTTKTSRNDGNDSGGRLAAPVILYMGRWDTSGMTRLILDKSKSDASLDGFLLHWVCLFESLHMQLYRDSLRYRTLVYADEICDLRGLNFGQLGPQFVAKVLKPWIRTTQTYYPETAETIRLLNSPSFLKLAWKIVAPMVSPRTVAKIQLVNGADDGEEEKSTAYDDAEEYVANNYRDL